MQYPFKVWSILNPIQNTSCSNETFYVNQIDFLQSSDTVWSLVWPIYSSALSNQQYSTPKLFYEKWPCFTKRKIIFFYNKSIVFKNRKEILKNIIHTNIIEFIVGLFGKSENHDIDVDDKISKLKRISKIILKLLKVYKTQEICQWLYSIL